MEKKDNKILELHKKHFKKYRERIEEEEKWRKKKKR